ncbi:MAG: 23S rRNA (pseudouridine(1915)-N(3))-methyltransferase RlmH [Verrucomicrobiota bacterium]
MKWEIYCIGKPSLAYAKAGTEEYLKRLRRYGTVTMHHLKEQGREKNSAALLEKSAGAYRIAMDERGDMHKTSQLAKKVEGWQMDGVKRIAILIGGADGHSEELRQACDEFWAIGKMTLMHELATVVLLEQIYRVHTLMRGEPYHRE